MTEIDFETLGVKPKGELLRQVGGAPTGGPQSIDDVIYTIGDKMVHYSGS